jgi:hypothetical protein
VHLVVVLLPLAALGAVVCAVLPRARRPYAPLVLAAALIALVSVLFAQGSGEELEDKVDKSELVHDHTEEGEQVLPWAIGVAVVAVGLAALPVLERRRRLPTAIKVAVIVLTVGIGVGAVNAVVQAGHSGAKATWSDVEDEGRGG